MILSSHGIIGSSIVQVVPLLDTYPNAAAAYSLRKLRTAYTGSAVEVRRTNLDVADIGFTSTGELDTAALLAFTGTGVLDNGFVTKWYDQSGNGLNATQSTALNQPKIVSSGSVILENGKPSISFDGLDDYFSRSSFTNINGLNHIYFFQVLQTTNNTLGNESRCVIWFPEVGSWGNIYTGVAQQSVNLRFGTGQSGNNQQATLPVNSTLMRLVSSYKNNTIDRVDVNGVNRINYTSALSTTANNENTLNIGRGSSAYMSMNLSEIIIYFSNESSNNLNIEQNINDFYSIY
jgi:hypothetical protein